MSRVSWIPEQIAESIAAAYTAGDTVMSIAGRFGIHASTVTRVAVRAGIPKRMPSRVVLSPEDQKRLADRYEAGEKSEDLARCFNTNLNTVTKIVRRLGGRVRALGKPWRGDSFLTKEGYRMLSILPGDPIADPMRYSNGHILEHRLVMARSIGRPLRDEETVHHVNGDRTDNRPENLQLRQGAHGRGASFQCAECGSNNVIAVKIAYKDIQ